jgi:hypothetical protein
MSHAFTYLKRAFLNHWNLLGLSGATAFSLLSGRPDVFLPVAAAAEVAWLAALASSARFQRHVDATEREGSSSGEHSLLGERAQRILDALPAPERRRFERLRRLCRELLDLSDGATVAPPQQSRVLVELRGENINRLLWIFLKLLHSRTALDRFFATTSEQGMRAQKEEAQRKLLALDPAVAETPERARQRASLEDIVVTAELRLQNFVKARQNHELLQLELERLDAKIAGIAEMGINRQDPRAVTGEIDAVSTSAIETERSMHEIDAITGLDFSDDQVAPLLLSRKVSESRS